MSSAMRKSDYAKMKTTR